MKWRYDVTTSLRHRNSKFSPQQKICCGPIYNPCENSLNPKHSVSLKGRGLVVYTQNRVRLYLENGALEGKTMPAQPPPKPGLGIYLPVMKKRFGSHTSALKDTFQCEVANVKIPAPACSGPTKQCLLQSTPVYSLYSSLLQSTRVYSSLLQSTCVYSSLLQSTPVYSGLL